MTPTWLYLVIWALTAVATWLLSDTRPLRPHHRPATRRTQHHTHNSAATTRHHAQKGL